MTTISVTHYGETWTVTFADVTTSVAVERALFALIAAGHSRENVAESAMDFANEYGTLNDVDNEQKS